MSSPLWPALMIARNVETCASILRGRRVRAANLDAFVLRRALRGANLPDPESFIVVTGDMLEAVNEAGALAWKNQAR